MKRVLQSPIVNAVCISIFTAFYSAVFLLSCSNERFLSSLYYVKSGEQTSLFWYQWSSFLARGNQRYIVLALAAITALTVFFLFARRRNYDEYHISILLTCLAVSIVLTLIANALLYLFILTQLDGIVEKFTLFVTIQWVSIVLADFVFVLICRWR